MDEKADTEINTDAITWMWDVTTAQDKKITEDNAAGVASRAYRPGPYTELELQPSVFVQTYPGEMRELITGEPSEAPTWQFPTKGYTTSSDAAVTAEVES